MENMIHFCAALISNNFQNAVIELNAGTQKNLQCLSAEISLMNDYIRIPIFSYQSSIDIIPNFDMRTDIHAQEFNK